MGCILSVYNMEVYLCPYFDRAATILKYKKIISQGLKLEDTCQAADGIG